MMSAAEIASLVQARPLVVDDVLPSFCDRLAREILSEERLYPHGNGSLNKGGWKSTDVLFHRPGTAAYAWRTYIEAVRLAGVRINPWAMINRKGSYHARHQHRIASTCGVYYVTVGDPVVPTMFELDGHEVPYAPAPGRLVLFSGQTWHRVPRYDGDAPRITIAFDVVR